MFPDTHGLHDQSSDEEEVKMGKEKPVSHLERVKAACMELFTYLTLECLRFMVLLK